METASYAQKIEARRRLSLLFCLYLAGGYRLPIRALRESLAQNHFIEAGLAEVKDDAAWLLGVGLVSFDGEVVTLTDAGVDACLGRYSVLGVKRPEPGEVAELRGR